MTLEGIQTKIHQELDAQNSFVPATMPAPLGVGAFRDELISHDMSVSKESNSIDSATYNRDRIYSEIVALSEKEPVQWNKMMLHFYQAQVALANNDIETCNLERERFQEVAKELYEKRKVEYDAIAAHLRHSNWMDGVGAASTAAGGVVTAVALASTPGVNFIGIPLIIMTAAISIAVIQLDRAVFNKKIGSAVETVLPKGSFGIAETAMTAAYGVFLAAQNLVNPVSLIGNGVSTVGNVVISNQKNKTEQQLQSIKYALARNGYDLDEVSNHLKTVLERYARETKDGQAVMSQENTLNQFYVS